MLLLILCYIIFINPSFSTGTIHNELSNDFYLKNRCQSLGDPCQQAIDCCAHLTCSSAQDQNLCLPVNKQMKRYMEDSIIPPYYDPRLRHYPYSINMLPFPFYNVYREKQLKTYLRSKLEWDHCQFHEDCGESNCCYVHFRFRSLPKSFCRPNRNDKDELCEPLTRYRSLKDVPAWKEFQRQEKEQKSKQEQQEEKTNNEQREPLSLQNIDLGQ